MFGTYAAELGWAEQFHFQTAMKSRYIFSTLRNKDSEPKIDVWHEFSSYIIFIRAI